MRLSPTRRPVLLIPLAFLVVSLIGTGLLALPIATAEPGGAPMITALFTAVSAVCVTGLIVQDTAVYWSFFGQVVILILFQIGGLGIMSGATLLGLVVKKHLQLSSRLVAQQETQSLGLGDVAGILKLIILVTIGVEAALALILSAHLHLVYDEPLRTAIWNGVFHAVSAFNNAGFSTYSDSLMRFVTDPVVLLPMMFALILGGLGFPVLHELRPGQRHKPRTVHFKITVWGSAFLLASGALAILAYEWNNPSTMGDLEPGGKLLSALFHSATARTAGFNTLDVGEMEPQTLAVNYWLMFIGGGSAGTAGGIKVTTFFLLFFFIWAEIRGDTDTVAFGRRIASPLQRQAMTVVSLGFATVGVGTITLLSMTPFEFGEVLFEAISAFATVGLTTGITDQLPPSGQLVIIALMFIGRVGTTTFAASLALRSTTKHYRYPEERPIVG
ncbi:potassium uptake protein, TrkH family [Halopseudomonas xinjiangensis]|uniref:Potassium uptake protein, TrkH family n=1 Tax=Halopseudomonas xinjiangensis TaxID=487184 RepID=A0A1H1WZD7_9GAMM|nr:potassium transporter TrkG [Halopseudomonas xinjiangensis]SDT02425.1 potassium uptake protein, TrkH family [Halopseudomonas xinjiangensis]